MTGPASQQKGAKKMAEELTLEELQAALTAKQHELRLAVDSEERNMKLAEHLTLRNRISAKEQELYFSLELPEALPEPLSGLSEDELNGFLDLNMKFRRALNFPESELTEPESELSHSRSKALAIQSQDIRIELDRRREESYEPGPNDPPAYEPEGYEAARGFVKSRPENNDYYVELFRDDPWYPAISAAHLELSRLIPGYNIAQIKEKFGGLRYYIGYPPLADTEGTDGPTEDMVRVEARAIVARAEAWVDGYEYAQRELKTED